MQIKMSALNYTILKQKHRALRSDYKEDFSLRIHRCLSWLQRAAQEINDEDSAFVFYWLAFNSAYSEHYYLPKNHSSQKSREKTIFQGYFDTMVENDRQHKIREIIEKHSDVIARIFKNQYIYAPFWREHHNEPTDKPWRDTFRDEAQTLEKIFINMQQMLSPKDMATVLSLLFDRLYVLRNQLFHGGATWGGGKNRDQIEDGFLIISALIPCFIDIMMDNPTVNWGRMRFPPVA